MSRCLTFSMFVFKECNRKQKVQKADLALKSSFLSVLHMVVFYYTEIKEINNVTQVLLQHAELRSAH